MNVDFVHINDWPWGRDWHYVVDGGIALGRASLLNDSKDELFVSDFMVAKENRRQGYGRYLLCRIELLAQTLGLHRVALWVDVCKPENAAFYEACGYTNEGFLDGAKDTWVFAKSV